MTSGIIFPNMDLAVRLAYRIDVLRSEAACDASPYEWRPEYLHLYAGSDLSFTTHPEDGRVALVLGSEEARERFAQVREGTGEVEASLPTKEEALDPSWFAQPEMP